MAWNWTCRSGIDIDEKTGAGIWKPGNFVFSGLAAALRSGADAVAGRNDAGCMAGRMGHLSCLGAGVCMAVGRIYRLGRFLGAAGICSDIISADGVLYPCFFAASFLGNYKGETDPGRWMFDPFIAPGDGSGA